MSNEIKDLFNSLQKDLHEFNTENKKRLTDLENKGSVDVVLTEKVDKINNAISDMEDKLVAANKKIEDLELSNSAKAEAEIKDDGSLAVFNKIGNCSMNAAQVAEYRNALETLVRRQGSVGYDIENTLSVSIAEGAGHWVSPDMSGEIIRRVQDQNPMRKHARISTTSKDRFILGKKVNRMSIGGWVGEANVESRSATTLPAKGEQEIPVHELYAYPDVTLKMLDDADYDVLGEMTVDAADAFAYNEEYGFLLGNGIQQPRGILDYVPTSTEDGSRAWGTLQYVASGQAATIPDGPEELISMVHKPRAKYLANAKWFMNRFTRALIRQIAGTNEFYFVAMNGGIDLLGYPVVTMDSIPSVGANNLVAIFGDMNAAYRVVDRAGIRMIVDPYSTKGKVSYYMWRRVGGDVVDFDAIKILKCAAS